MAVFTYSLSNSLLNEAFRNSEYSQPSTVYVALFTTATDENGNGTEVTGGSYARQAITFAAASSGSISNSGTITFPTASADWGTISYIAIMSAVSSGTMMVQGPATKVRTIYSGDTYVIQAGDVVVRMA